MKSRTAAPQAASLLYFVSIFVLNRAQMQASPSKWLRLCPARPQARIRLLCFTYAGGAGSEYVAWSRNSNLPEWVEVVVIAMPALTKDAFITSKPYAIYGHSMGTFVALETLREFRNRGLPMPVHFFAGASSEPSVRTRKRPIAELGDSQLKQMLREMGGTPEEVLENDEVMHGLVYPVVRADWTVLDFYEVSEQDPLPVPITSIRGVLDHLVSEAQQRNWQKHTTQYDFVEVKGDHFFLKTNESELLQIITTVLVKALGS